MKKFSDRIILPVDLICAIGQEYTSINISDFHFHNFCYDIGTESIALFTKIVSEANTIVINGPVGCYEEEAGARGTRVLWDAIACSPAYTIIGGGDSVSALKKFSKLSNFNYVSTGGGAMLRYVSGVHLPLIESLKTAHQNIDHPISHNGAVRR